MVGKNVDLIEELIFADVHESYLDSELESIYNELFLDEGFDESDVLVLTGGPNELEESQRAESLIQYLNEFERESIPVLLTTPSQKQRLDEDGRVTEDDYIFHPMDPDSFVDEFKALKSDISEGDELAVFTNDYHVPRYEKMLSSLDDSVDYLVFGAEFESDESRYKSKWNSEAIRTFLPKQLKDFGKKYLR